MTLATRTLTGTYIDPTTGHTLSGTITITPSAALQAVTTGVMVATETLTLTLDSTGSFSVALVPTDTAEISPTGWTYTVTEHITGAAQRTYSILVPTGAGTLNLATIAPAIPQPPVVQYVLAASVGTTGGPAGPLDGTGKLPLAQVPAGSSGVQVGGDIGGTNVAPTVISTHLAVPLPLAQGGTNAATAPAARTSLGLGGAAVLNVGAVTGTVAAGDDSRIIGAVQTTRQILAGTGLTGGGDLSADRTHAVTYGAIAGTAAQGNDSRLADARPYPLSGYGLLAASADPMTLQGSSGIGGNTIWSTRVWIPAGTVITKLWAAVRTAGTWDAVTTPNQLGLYDDTGAKVDQTPDDGTLWAGTGWRGGSIGTPVAAQAAGRFVYVLALVRGITGLSVAFPTSPNDANAGFCSTGPTGGNRRAMYVTATALPASFAPASYGTSTGYLMLIGIS